MHRLEFCQNNVMKIHTIMYVNVNHNFEQEERMQTTSCMNPYKNVRFKLFYATGSQNTDNILGEERK